MLQRSYRFKRADGSLVGTTTLSMYENVTQVSQFPPALAGRAAAKARLA
jgi:hypothetical protein